MTATYPGLRVDLGPDTGPVDVFDDARNLHIRRGLSPAGLSDNLDPGTLTFELEGAAYNPQTNPLTRPGGAVSVVLGPTAPPPPPPPPPADPLTYVGVSSPVEATSATSATGTRPPGVLPGDLLLASVMHRGNATTVPDGWTLVTAATTTDVVVQHHEVYQRTVSSVEPASYVFAFSGTASRCGVGIAAWRSAHVAAVNARITTAADNQTSRHLGAPMTNAAPLTDVAYAAFDACVYGTFWSTPEIVTSTGPVARTTLYGASRRQTLTRTDTIDQPAGDQITATGMHGTATVTHVGQNILVRLGSGPAPSPPPDPVPGDDRRVFTGTITRARLGFSARDSTDEIVVHLEATDAIAALSTAPHATAIGGSYAQRIHHITDPLGVATVVHDTEGNKATPVLPTNETTALGNLRLVRDTNHGIVFVDKTNTLQAYADRDRPLTDVAATFTDVRTPGAVHYTALEPVFDTAELVNVVTVESLTGDGAAVSGTYSDADSLATWGPGPGSVTVNEGQPDAHAYRYLFARADPTLTAERVVFNATEAPAVAADLELYQTARVIRTGLLDETTQILALEHHITHRRWTVAVTCRPAEGLPTRWVDLPPALTWAQVDPALSWFDVVTWTP